MQAIYSLLLLCIFSFTTNAQIITLNPVSAGSEDQVTITFDASQGNKELLGATKVYMHHGVVTDKPDGTAWKYVKGNWGLDNGIGEMEKVAGESNKWQITFSPNIRSYFNVPAGENIFRISCVFRSADGTKKGTISAGEYGWGTVTSNLDMYINLNNKDFVQIITPSKNEDFYSVGQPISIQASASSDVTEMQLWIDEGLGFEQKAETTSGKTIQHNYIVSQSVELIIKVTAKINSIDAEAIKNHNVVVRKPTEEAIRPPNLKQGVNYDIQDPTKATLVFLAPFKDFVYVVGDFNDWKVLDAYQMKRDGEYYWLELSNLTPQKDYVYQYWIDGELKIADPYTEVVADPWNDKWIEPSVYPNLPPYDRTDFGIASVLKTAQIEYQWAASENEWKRPNVNHLVIYELHVRDFLASHSYKDLADTMSYLKRLGINALELLPVNEFEGNDSWGYNPSFYFALDKYYGTKDQLKKVIEVAHQNGIAVILDAVLNHAFRQSPMVLMYYDKIADKPLATNPWFNREYVGQYQWGYDFNHESPYTKQFLDDVNRYWIEEYHIDGYRFDFTKGFTNYAPGGSVDGFDQSRINILKRMADKLWEVDDEAYIILEHWSPAAEEKILGDYGMKMWGNRSYDFVPATVGNASTGSFANMDQQSHVLFFNSHDERRIAEHCLTEGRSNGNYNIKSNEIMYERVKMAAAFTYLQPGPKMIWQFDELGYDIDINFNGRTGRKPYPWGPNSLQYYNDELRTHIYDTYAEILKLRNTITPEVLAAATKNHANTGDTRRLVFNTPDTDIVLLGNFGLTNRSISPGFTKSGTWYNYFKGDSISVTSTTLPVSLKPGEWHIYTSNRLSEGKPELVEVYDNPVTITPSPFTINDEITIRFDATKASKKGTNGLVDAEKVYIHSGVVLNTSTNNQWSNTKGTFLDDGLGEMTEVSDNIWEIKMTPQDYYQINPSQEVDKLAMYFRDATNTELGYGFRNSIIMYNVQSNEPMVTIDPASFQADTEITITFHANRGNKELLNASKIYMHSGTGIIDTPNPQTSAWNNVVGNWGMDDGIGAMTKIAGTNRWQIKLRPRQYYDLNQSDFPYWIAAVFRSADGNIKGTGAPGNLPNGFIASNFDIFLKNQGTVNVNDLNTDNFIVYPNPTSGDIFLKGLDTDFHFQLTSLDGKVVLKRNLQGEQVVDLNHILPGTYIFTISNSKLTKTGKLIKI